MRTGDSPGGDRETKGQPGITQAALFGSCPRCCTRSIWKGPAELAASCATCGLDMAVLEPRGRALYLVILPVTVLLVLAAVTLDDLVRLPVWALMLLWGALVPLAVIGALRFAKAAVLLARLDKE